LTPIHPPLVAFSGPLVTILTSVDPPLTDGRGGGRRARSGWAGGWPSRRPREEHGWAVTSLVGGGAQAGDGLMGGGGAHVVMRSTGLLARERSTGVEVLFGVTLVCACGRVKC
jgi:hypothetical protein